jgi:predicted TIM-barrel fold metal-dependent hydrolase
MRKSQPEPEPRLPLKLEPVSNGEVMPPPASPRLRAAIDEAWKAVEENARRTGRSRRDFLQGASAVATVMLAANRAYAGSQPGGSFAVTADMALDEAAAQSVLAGPEFVFDVQTHHVNPDRDFLTANPHFGFLKKLPQGKCGESDPLRCYSRHHFVKDIFMDSDTSIAVLSALPAAPDTTPITLAEMDESRRTIDLLEGTPRLQIHGQVLPNMQPLRAQLDGMERLVKQYPIKAWKMYTQWGPDSSGKKGFWLDDPKTGIPVLEQARKLGAKVICVHKGLSLEGFDPQWSGCRDIGPVAKMFPDLTFIVYHSGIDFPYPEGPHDPKAEWGIDGLINSVEKAGVKPGSNVYAELGTAWRIVMSRPEMAAHALGKLLKHFGEDRVLWGTDCVWYGSPQDQIQAFRAFQIGAELREKHGYPELTPALKAKVLGLNAAVPYGIDVPKVMKQLKGDRVSEAKAAYAEQASPTFHTNGPRTRAEFLRLQARQVGPA